MEDKEAEGCFLMCVLVSFVVAASLAVGLYVGAWAGFAVLAAALLVSRPLLALVYTIQKDISCPISYFRR